MVMDVHSRCGILAAESFNPTELRTLFVCTRLPKYCTRIMLVSLCLVLVIPAAALDDPSPSSHALRLGYDHNPAPRLSIGTILHVWSLVGGLFLVLSSSVVGPLMGITSVLWLMMRNDSAIHPKWAWMMFGAWLFFVVTYVMVQCRRVSNHRLYIFLVVATASTFMCIVGIIQRSSFQSGLVTVIPPCTSFAAYSVAYFFPAKQCHSESIMIP